MSNDNVWRTVFLVSAAVCSFLLVQPQVQQYPLALLVLGAINVALAAIRPDRESAAE